MAIIDVQTNTVIGNIGMSMAELQDMINYNEVKQFNIGSQPMIMFKDPTVFTSNGYITPTVLYDTKDRHEHYRGSMYASIPYTSSSAFRYQFYLYPCINLMDIVEMGRISNAELTQLSGVSNPQKATNTQLKNYLNPKYETVDNNSDIGMYIGEYCNISLTFFNLSDGIIGKTASNVDRFSRLPDLGSLPIPNGMQGVWDSGGCRWRYGSVVGGVYRWFPWFAYRKDDVLVDMIIRANIMPNWNDEVVGGRINSYDYICYKPFGVHYYNLNQINGTYYGNYFLVVGVTES